MLSVPLRPSAPERTACTRSLLAGAAHRCRCMPLGAPAMPHHWERAPPTPRPPATGKTLARPRPAGAQAVTCVNLVNQHGSEGTLEQAFAKEAARCAAGRGAAGIGA